MSKRITIEEEKRIASWYGDKLCSQEYIRRNLRHGRNQVNRILQPKNIAYLLYDEIELHDSTKYANNHLQERLENTEFALKIAIGFLSLSALYSILSIFL